MRLIDADELKKALAKNITIWAFNTSYDGVLAEVIDNAPTVAVNCKDCDGYEAGYSAGLKDVERPQGKWIELRKYDFKCSLCGESFLDMHNYCPTCGAAMKGGAK